MGPPANYTGGFIYFSRRKMFSGQMKCSSKNEKAKADQRPSLNQIGDLRFFNLPKTLVILIFAMRQGRTHTLESIMIDKLCNA